MNSTDNDTPHWSKDRILDIVILGPMGETDNPAASTTPVQRAVQSLLGEEQFKTILNEQGITEHKVHTPEGLDQGEIVHNVLSLLDTADLVILNITPKASNPDRANVFYELGLVNALGIPSMLVATTDTKPPFYAQTTVRYRSQDFTEAALANELREHLRKFLEEGTVSNDRVTQFYGLPVVDISAAVGLATGYYYNFISRLLREGGFLGTYPGDIKQVIYVRPDAVGSTYEVDIAKLTKTLEKSGYTLEKGKKLDPPQGETKGPLWFDHVNGIVIDIPRTIYPLQRSPRLLSLLTRNTTFKNPRAEAAFEKRRTQMENALLDRVEEGIRYQLRIDGPAMRSKILHFSTIEETPALVKSLLV